jgi:hypothetical protein
MANVAYQGMSALKIDAKAVKSASRGASKDETLVAIKMPPHCRSTKVTYIIDAIPGFDPKSPFAEFLSADRWYPKPGSNPKGNTEIKDVHVFADGTITLIAPAWQFTTKGLDAKLVASLDVMKEVLADRAKNAKPPKARKAKVNVAATAEAPTDAPDATDSVA